MKVLRLAILAVGIGTGLTMLPREIAAQDNETRLSQLEARVGRLEAMQRESVQIQREILTVLKTQQPQSVAAPVRYASLQSDDNVVVIDDEPSPTASTLAQTGRMRVRTYGNGQAAIPIGSNGYIASGRSARSSSSLRTVAYSGDDSAGPAGTEPTGAVVVETWGSATITLPVGEDGHTIAMGRGGATTSPSVRTAPVVRAASYHRPSTEGPVVLEPVEYRPAQRVTAPSSPASTHPAGYWGGYDSVRYTGR